MRAGGRFGCAVLLSGLVGLAPACNGSTSTTMCIDTTQTVCDGACFDLARDPDHCGTCDTVCGPGGRCVAGTCHDPDCVDQLDVLFVVGNSVSAQNEQFTVAAELPRFVRQLSSGDVDGDGVREFSPFRSIHVGVVTTDLGAVGSSAPGCSASGDGVLRTAGDAVAGCSATYPAVHEFTSGADDPTTFGEDLACVARVGHAGCGFTQPLESALKALSPASAQPWTAPGYAPPTFAGGTPGHGGPGDANEGLVRTGSRLAIVFVANRDDCSASDLSLYDAASPTYTSELALRCTSYPDALTDIDRYVTGLAALRIDPSRLVIGIVAGVPVAADGLSPGQILADPAMTVRVDPATSIVHEACSASGGAISATPARRLVTLADRMASRGVGFAVSSICDARPLLDPVVRAIGEPMNGCP